MAQTSASTSSRDFTFMRRALRLAKKAQGCTSPNPMVGAVLVKAGRIIGQGWHHCAGEPHAEIEALQDAERRGNRAKGATLYVTLEPCSTHGRTPPCTEAIIAAGIRKVIVGATDPNPRHRGRGLTMLKRRGIVVDQGVLEEQCRELNEAFNHWIVHRVPFVTVKAAMTLDGKIATANGQSKWITGSKARGWGMNLRGGADAILVGIETVLADDPSLTYRGTGSGNRGIRQPRRIVLDSMARTPVTARVVTDAQASSTTIAVSRSAPKRRVEALAERVQVVRAPASQGRINLRWLLRKLGSQNVTSVLVEGGGEVNSSFLEQHLAHRIAFFYAPKILGGRASRRAVAGEGARNLAEALRLKELNWRRIGPDLMLTARVAGREGR